MKSFESTTALSKITPSQYKDFSCGVSALDEYLKRYAKHNEKKGIGKTFVLLKQESVIGYYTLSAAQISITDISKTYPIKLPAYPVPASRLCRLAVDKSMQGQHAGEYLLVDAIERVRLAAINIAIHAIVVDSKSETAKRFYSKYGFIPLEGSELTLFLPMSTVEKI